MNDFGEDPSIHEVAKDTQSISVLRVSENELQQTAKSASNKVRIVQGTWQEVPPGTPIENKGAIPYLIVYVKDLTNNAVISGHFPSTNEARIMGFAKDTIDRKTAIYQKQALESPGLVSTEADELKRLKDPVDKDFQAYRIMLKRVEELSSEKGQKNFEVYLFGQNFPFYDSNSLSEGVVEQHDVIHEFTSRGIPLSNVHNYRSIGIQKVDDTFYSSENSQILHSTRQ